MRRSMPSTKINGAELVHDDIPRMSICASSSPGLPLDERAVRPGTNPFKALESDVMPPVL